MSNTVKIDIAASDNGSIDKVTGKTKALNKELKAAQTTASSLGKGASSTVAYQKAKAMSDESFEYRQARGSRGTGAEGRDFAKQAQGLGGLVHVYATFAANLFAVSAAFTALSKAADYENMVKGLDQLGAASGRNLGYMAKQVVTLTDNAVSLKEAMATVAQTSSAGMSSDQIERLAIVAKQTSQALGRDMTDSLNRLSRGITKVEPELLDELGIFVRVDKAAQDYARTIGKSALSLTEFERRQAFALASLDQAEKKFGSINIDANPYNQLQASFINLAYSGGELINKVLGPIAKILSESPGALAGVMASIATILLKQAIPALSQWRSGLAESAKLAEEKAKRISDSLNNFKMNKGLSEAIAEDNKALEARANALKLVDENKLFGKKTKSYYDLQDPKSNLDTAQQQTAVKLQGVTKEIEKQEKVLRGLAAAEKESIAIAEARIKKLMTEKQQYAMLAVEIENAKEAMQRADIAGNKAESHDREDWLRQKLADRASKKAESMRIRAEVVQDTETLGARQAYKNIGENIDAWNKDPKNTNNKIGAVGSAWLKMSGALSIVSNVLGSVISAFSTWILIGSAVIAALQVLNNWLTTNKKELLAFNNSLERVASTSEMVKKTLEGISNKDVLEGLSSDSLLSKANALKEVGDAAASLSKNFIKAQESQSSWSSFWDSAFGVVGKGDFDKFRESMKTSISDTLDILGDGAAGEESKKKLAKALGLEGIDKLTKKNIDKALEGNSLDKLKAVSKVQREIGEERARTANNISSAFDTLSEASKNYNNIVNSLNPNDEMSKMAFNAAKGFFQLNTELQNTEDTLGAFIKTTGNFDNLKLLPAENALELNALRLEADRAATAIQRLKDEEAKLRKEASGAVGSGMVGAVNNKKNKAADDIKASWQAIESGIKEKIGTSLTEAFSAAAKISLDILSIGLTAAGEKAGIAVSRALLSGINNPEAIKLEAGYKTKEIDINLKMLESQTNLYLSQEALRLAIEAQTLEDKKKSLEAKTNRTTDESTLLEKITKTLIPNIEKAQNTLGKVRGAGGKINATALTDKDVLESPELLGAKNALVGLQSKQAEAQGQKAAIAIEAQIKSIAAASDLVQQRISSEKEIERSGIAQLTQQIELSSVFNEELQNKRLLAQESLRTLEIDSIDEKIKKEAAEYTYRMSQVSAKSREAEAIQNNYRDKMAALGAEKKKTYQEQDVQRSAELVKLEEDRLAAKKQQLEISNKLLEFDSFGVTTRRNANKITESQAILEQAKIDKAKKLNEFAVAEAQIRAKFAGKTDNTSKAALAKEIADKKTLVDLENEYIDLQAKYNAELLLTGETLREAEKAGQYTSNYFSAMGQDFTNKISALVAATRSAADTFNEGFINAIDNSIDEFFGMLQRSELTMKDMVNFVRNALSDVFRDTASQLMKNAWKDLSNKLLGDTSADKASNDYGTALENLKAAIDAAKTSQEASTKSKVDSDTANTDRYVEASSRLVDALDRNTGARSGAQADSKESTDNKSNDVSQTSSALQGNEADIINKGLAESVDRAEQNNTKLGGTLTTFGSDMIKVASGQMSAMDMFQKLIGSLSGVFSQFIQGLFASQQFSGGDSGSSLFGTIAKGIMGYITGGPAGAAASLISSGVGTAVSSPVADSQAGIQQFELPNARGGVYGSESLSAYSNSIVTSPTTFAFAKGSPTSGLMGESGPEAIIPLKRDAQGNLGIRGGGSGDNNNIEINITIENGNVSKDDSSGATKENAAALGNVIKAVVSQELIKQTRPGGLLAR